MAIGGAKTFMGLPKICVRNCTLPIHRAGSDSYSPCAAVSSPRINIRSNNFACIIRILTTPCFVTLVIYKWQREQNQEE